MLESKQKHLEFIQNSITRMNTNSFLIKGWTVTIVSAILAIYVIIKDGDFILFGIFPIVIFWFLDTCYLTQERKFRGLYNDVAEVSENPKQIKPYDIRPDLYTGGKYSYWNVFWSSTIWTLYLSIITFFCGLYIYLKF